MKNTKQKLYVFLLSCFYKVKFLKPEPWELNGVMNYRWPFEIIPKKVSVTIALVIMSGFIILTVGITGFIDFLKDVYTAESGPYFALVLPQGQQPKKFDAYLKYI